MTRRIRYSLWTRVVLLGLYLAGIVVQFVAAGYGFFEGDFELHEVLGYTVMHAIPVFILIATAVLWRGGTQLWLALAVGILGILQPMLVEIGSWAAYLHPLNALVLFFLAHALMRRDLVAVRAAPERPLAATHD